LKQIDPFWPHKDIDCGISKNDSLIDVDHTIPCSCGVFFHCDILRWEELQVITIKAMIIAVSLASLQHSEWYSGDERCPPPKDDGTYSSPYHALDHPHDYPTFTGANIPGWSCSYQRGDGVIIQYGDGRTPQEQWNDLWRDNRKDRKLINPLRYL